MGRGEDGKWVSHRSFRVIQVGSGSIPRPFEVQRIENGKLWSSYANSRKSIAKCQATMKMMNAALRKRAEDGMEELDIEEQARASCDVSALRQKLFGAAMVKSFARTPGTRIEC